MTEPIKKREPRLPKPAPAPPRPKQVDRSRIFLLGSAALLLVVAFVAFWSISNAHEGHERLRVHVIRAFPHDEMAFTQGLEVHDGVLYETTGLEGESSVRRVNLETGEVAQHTDLPDNVFGEGMTVVGDQIFQVTWLNGKAFVFDRSTLRKVRELEYSGEGWGLCYDGTRIIMSNGSDRLAFRDPRTFEKTGEIRVRRLGRPVRHLNELECVNGVVYANVWQHEDIVRIDPESGEVTATIDASGLLTEEESREVDVLNGIAYLAESGHFLLTGKRWPKMFEVELVSQP